MGRAFFPVPADGEYTVAVTTYPDFDFTGAGAVSGRYALTLDTYRGTILPLGGDDVTTELPLGFSFPFQGSPWSHVWVSSNGSLTFGAPEAVQGIEDLQKEGFLAGPPRIAPFLTDLDPSGSYNYLTGPERPGHRNDLRAVCRVPALERRGAHARVGCALA
jgi:hypothetical protein